MCRGSYKWLWFLIRLILLNNVVKIKNWSESQTKLGGRISGSTVIELELSLDVIMIYVTNYIIKSKKV